MSDKQQERAMTISENLKKFRVAKKLTQREVWEAAEISKSSYTAYEGGNSEPTAEVIVRMSKVLGVTTDELLLSEQERTLSGDMSPILKRFESLPEDLKNQARIALKGILFGYEQEALR